MGMTMKKVFCLVVVTGFVLLGSAAHASVKEIKLYREAFPEAKVKCIDCHVMALPKKDDGAHEPNAYGQAVLKEAAVPASALPTVDTYKKVGSIEDFNKKLELEKK